MTVSDHIDSLRAKHADLERKIEAEEQRPMPDAVAVHTLKKEKLRIKDEIVRLSG